MSNRRKTATQRRSERGREARVAVAAARQKRQDEGELDVPEYGVVVSYQDEAWRVVWDVDPEPFTGLLALQHMRGLTLGAFERTLVADARELGMSWDAIGFALGVSGEAVRKRLAA